MAAAAATMTVLTFHAGEIGLAVAAEAVAELAADRVDRPHVAELLALTVAAPAKADARRLVALVAGDARAELRVDAPVGIENLEGSRLLGLPPALPAAAIPALAGFVAEGERILLLLSAAHLCRVAARATGPVPTATALTEKACPERGTR